VLARAASLSTTRLRQTVAALEFRKLLFQVHGGDYSDLSNVEAAEPCESSQHSAVSIQPAHPFDSY